MGLRERKAERTRGAIREAALRLFEKQGFEQTTMEQIAEVAEVGVATLYRYFPTKDQVLLGQVTDSISALADYVAGRPLDEPLDEVLGHALHDLLADTDRQAEQIERLRAQLDRASGPRAKLWDLWAQQRTLLEDAIAARAGVEPTEMWVGIAAHTTMMVAEMALDFRRSTLSPSAASEYADKLLEVLASPQAVIPRLPGPKRS
ncbi:helix-turn-helix domain-containing protein [Gryllotalpicola koreensis]|uniref:HTH tetR-type domain-containing protein n=1 Tax=Gryllotalpicola koreensis TaxID=993086 RepID=A0ABP8ACX9_9MICO